MALVKSTLKSTIEANLHNEPGSENDFATSLFDAYESYASAAADASQDMPTGFPNKSSAVSTLASAMTGVNKEGISNSQAAQQLGSALGNALVTFWTGIAFSTGIPLAPMISEITALVSMPGVPSAATISKLDPTEDRSVAASVWADAMDAFTKTVQVTITGMMAGPSGPVPAPPITAPIT